MSDRRKVKLSLHDKREIRKFIRMIKMVNGKPVLTNEALLKAYNIVYGERK